MGKDPTTFVASDLASRHSSSRSTRASRSSTWACSRGPRRPTCRPATGETIGKAKACWAGGTVKIYLNAGRDPAGGGFQRVAAADLASTVATIKATYQGLTDPNDWTGDGKPEAGR